MEAATYFFEKLFISIEEYDLFSNLLCGRVVAAGVACHGLISIDCFLILLKYLFKSTLVYFFQIYH